MTRARYIGIIGSRRRNEVEDYVAVARAYFRIVKPGDVVVSGGCPLGADRFAEVLADCVKRVRLKIFYPDKSKLDKHLLKINPRAAYAKINYARNTLVAEASVDYLIACVAHDRTGGTEDTIKKWKKTKSHLTKEEMERSLFLV